MNQKKELSILFIGNSFSYYHALPKLIAYFARASGSGHLVVDGVFRGGATLKVFWDHGRALKKLKSRPWDYVVLQERGRLGGIVKGGVVHVAKPRSFFIYATKFDKEIKRIGAKTILYCPPAFLGIGLPDDADKLQAAYSKLARKLHVDLIPAGLAFALALKKQPSLLLYETDGHHPNPAGTYLIASMFYKKLFYKKVGKIPTVSYSSKSERLPRKPKEIRIPETEARFLWSISNQLKL